METARTRRKDRPFLASSDTCECGTLEQFTECREVNGDCPDAKFDHLGQRQLAIANGDKLYNGTPCWCGEPYRYTSNHTCISAKSHIGTKPRTLNKQDAIARGENMYIGSPCRRSGHTLRYVVKGRCVECAREESKKRVRRKIILTGYQISTMVGLRVDH